ncbi:hypothetical protein [Pseudomonas aeruginosa]|uniref:hypothetical protein n=2 Tax=Pseudomonas aeruginosa TaxID=287 RepID=UPI0003BB07B8|nr:hypothetical protein [Pseudomonas aeruginosa]ERZ09750.1 hypothetical protein Q008_04294 [Pseudomonas aeruginosa JJ692]RPO68567.1 hypothetical protein IPC1177_19145 [Pseudomonas aeruginosa]
MILYGVTIDLQVVPVRLGSQQMMECRDVFNSEKEAKARAEELRALCAAAPGKEVPQAWLDVQAERRRQITAEGWTPEHDDLYCAAELPRAAAAYILNGANDEAPAIWSFSAKWWKPRDARSNYVRAGALILAEIERLDRAAPGKEVPQAWLDVQAERRRQITAEGWTPEHDDLYCAAELPRAAAAYILNGANDEAPAIWSFSAKWWKPRDARSNYVRAGALILAEIERLDRAAPGKEVGHE